MIDAHEQHGATVMQRLAAEAKRKPQTALILLALLVILCGMWVRVLMGSAGPLPASAAAPLAKGGALPPADGSVAGLYGRAQPHSLAEWAQQKSGPVTRNLFAVPFESFPLDPAHPLPQTRESAKSGPSEADQFRERQIIEREVNAEASKLQLEGIVLGASPRVWVNGSLVAVGQSVGETGLKVVRIEARHVVVERDGIQVDLIMK